jgi:hypothetical protein
MGAIIGIQKLKLLRVKIPLKGQIGLSDRECLTLEAGSVTYIGSKGEPIFLPEVEVRGVTRQGELLLPEKDPDIDKWLMGLDTNNGYASFYSIPFAFILYCTGIFYEKRPSKKRLNPLILPSRLPHPRAKHPFAPTSLLNLKCTLSIQISRHSLEIFDWSAIWFGSVWIDC